MATAAVLALAACDGAPGALQGTVTADVGSQAGEVTVSVFSDVSETLVAETRTSALGTFRFGAHRLPAGTYRVRIGDRWWPDAATWVDAAPVQVSGDGGAVTDLSLASEARLTGKIVDLAGLPVGNVLVAATPVGGVAAVASALTDAEGTFSLGLIERGEHQLALADLNDAEAISVIPLGGVEDPITASTQTEDDVALGRFDVSDGHAVAVPKVVSVSAGGRTTCAVHDNGTVSCWGEGSSGRLGNGLSTSSPLPVTVSGLTDAVAVSVGLSSACAIRRGGSVACWGFNGNGQYGNGNQVTSSTPVPSLVSGVTSISIGAYNACGVTVGATAVCWGGGSRGALGNGGTSGSYTPLVVPGLSGVTEVYGSYYRGCARLDDGTVRCWGDNEDGQIGNGTTTQSLTPVAASGITDATSVGVGYYATCAVRAGGTVSCFGDNRHGQLADGTDTSSPTPVSAIGVTGVQRIAGGDSHFCATFADGTVGCWGYNAQGQVGNGTTSGQVRTPATVAGIADAVMVTAAANHSCALHGDHELSCWGHNSNGQLGNGTTISASTPVAVTFT